MENDEYFLNSVDITSNIRTKGEYKYYYCGENNSESDKSFTAISTMWFNEKITSDMEILSSCYNPINTAQIFYNNKTNTYTVLVYKNIIDYRNENMQLKLLHNVNLSINLPLEINNNQFQKENIDKKKVNIFLVGKNYLLINIIDYNILLLDYSNGNYITIFCRLLEANETLFNIIDTFDEPYKTNGEQRIRTYVFLSKKNQERKTPTYSYKYFIIQKDAFKIKNILLHSIDFDLGNAKPLGLKIGKIFQPDSSGQKFSFIFIFISGSTLFQLVTDYDNLNFHNMLKKNSRVENNNKDNDENKNEDSIDYDQIDKKSLNESDKNNNRTKYWTIKRKIESEKKNFVQNIKIELNINDKRPCSFVIFFESKNIISFNFNYTDTPEEIKNKIFVKYNINLSSDQKIFEKYFEFPAKLYKFIDLYMFKDRTFFNYSRNNLVLCDNYKMHIYSEENDYPVYTYEFYQEELSLFITFEGIGCTFLLTGTKLFKIIFNQGFALFSDQKIFKNEKIPINYYKQNKKLSYPVFEFQPENIWNSYCVSLGLEKIEFDEDEMVINDFIDESRTQRYSKNNKKQSSKNTNIDKYCALCGKKSDKSCSDCNMRYYCSKEHFKYDFYTYHFFECQWIQFFSRKDIMNIPDKEIRYKILYNELIKVCGRILTFIFMRIYSKKDYQYFLNMIITMVKILDNFGFKINLSEFSSCNYTLNERIINRYQKIIFYQEALFFYMHLNFLKCTFALKSNLHNLTDCYLKIINNDIIPMLTPKMNKRLISMKCEKLNIDILYNNPYFNEFNSELFFDIEKFVKNNSAPNNTIDLVEEYITKHLMTLSLLFKFKNKINSLMEVQNSFVNINLMFDDHFNSNEGERKIASYCYFFTSFYLVEIGKIPQTVKLLKRMIALFSKMNNDNNTLKYLTYYNLGLLQYALGYFDIGIHNIETAYKLIVENNFSDKTKLKVMNSLVLAYLNKRNLYKAFILIKKSIQDRKKLCKKGDEIECTKLNVYLNYINDLYEYIFISKARLLIKEKYKNIEDKKLMTFVLGEEDKEMVISEQDISPFIKVAKFIWELPDEVLRQLNIDNPPKIINNNAIKEEHYDKNVSFNSDVSVSMSNVSFMYNKEKENEKDDMEEDYEEEIEIKTSLYDAFSRKQQQEFTQLKTIYLKRDIILRDTLGDIEKFNINYDPIFAAEFERIVEKLKSSFLLKEIFYCFQNEKWRDELYNYNQNNIIFGLSKYLKMEKIKNMLAIEKTKIMEALRQKKLKRQLKEDYVDINKDNLLIDNRNQIIIKDKNGYIDESSEDEIEISKELTSKSSSENSSNEKDEKIGKEKVPITSFLQFKADFISALTELEKDKGNQDLYDFLSFDENYLFDLYTNVFKNNPDYKFIFQNPLLILNYIFIEINKPSEIDSKKIKMQSEPENKIIKEIEKQPEIKSEIKEEIKEEKKEKKEKKENIDINSISSSFNSNYNNEKLEKEEKSNKEIINSEKQENESKNEEKNDADKKEKENKNMEDNNEIEEESDINDEQFNQNLVRKNSYMEKFEKDENIYDYIRDEININYEISLEYIPNKMESKLEQNEQKEFPITSRKSANQIPGRKSEVRKNKLFFSLIQDKKRYSYKSSIEEINKFCLNNKENSYINPEIEKTFALLKNQKNRRTKSNSQELNININQLKSLKEEEKNENQINNLYQNKNINYMPFINKSKKNSIRFSKRISINKSDYNEEPEKEIYFDLKKEMELIDIKNDKKIKMKRERNLTLDINAQKNYKNKNKRNNRQHLYEPTNSLEKIIKNKSDENKNKTMQEKANKYINKNKGKNSSLRFKSKEQREKELEAGAMLYLKNDYKLKKKLMHKNNSISNEKISKNKSNNINKNNNISVKKRIIKSTDEKRLNTNQFDIAHEKMLKIPNNKRGNRNKKVKQGSIKFNSSTTINSTSSGYNKFIKSPLNNKKNNINKNIIKNESKNKNKKSNLFKEEYKKIILFNQKKKAQSQEKNNENKNLVLNLDNIKENDIKNTFADKQNKTTKNIEYNITSPFSNREYIKYFNNPKTGNRKYQKLIKNSKKNNFIPTTNYTNSDSPGYSRLITFQGKGNNNISQKTRSKWNYND